MRWLWRSAALPIVAFVAVSPRLRAQGFERRLEMARQSIEDGDASDAIEVLESCLETRPGDGGCAFELARAYATARNLEASLKWLDQSIEWGFGSAPLDVDQIEGDATLVPMHGDPRFERALDRARALAWKERSERDVAAKLPRS